MSKDEALEDCKTHREAWRDAILTTQHASKEHGDVSYWSHELAVFDRVFKTLNSLAEPVQESVGLITPLMEQQMFDDWCPYKGNPDPRTVWASAIDAVNGLLLGVTPPAAQTAVPEGWKLVPVEPTDAMVQAAHYLDLSYMPGQEGADRAAIYRAMLTAAPEKGKK